MVDHNYFIVIGSSKGLGAAIVNRLLQIKSAFIIGISRSTPDKISNSEKLIGSKRFQHIALDIGSNDCEKILKKICTQLNQKPVFIIFNAACLDPDILENKLIDHRKLDEVNRVGIKGFVNVLSAFEDHLLKYGGVFVGISSLTVFSPLFYQPRIGYPATKAYLEMALHCLRIIWPKHIKIVTVRLGPVGTARNIPFSKWIIPSYEKTAAKIIESITKNKPPSKINFPFISSILFRFIGSLPNSIFYWLAGFLWKKEGAKSI